MPTIAPERPENEVRPGFRGFTDLAVAAGLDLEPFQHRIARAVFNGPREVLKLLPRGNGKTALQALVALHHLLTVEDAEIYCCASSRDQAKVLFQYAARFARELDHPNVVHPQLELRWCPDPEEPTDFTRYLRVLPAEAPRLFGLTPSLMILDEYQARPPTSCTWLSPPPFTNALTPSWWSSRRPARKQGGRPPRWARRSGPAVPSVPLAARA